MKILITGGAGFIGSTIGSACLDRGIEVVVLDDLSKGRVEFTEGRHFVEGDLGDPVALEKVVANHPDIDAVVHCGAHIVVPESVEQPLDYYENNVSKTLTMVRTLIDLGVHRLLFSSSASIYAPSDDLTVDETSPLAASSPYARTKLVDEMLFEDVAATGALQVLSLRYFNPIGCDPQMRTGLQIRYPSHALGKLIQCYEAGEPFTITGTDWPTPDGTGIRDYVHVWDLALAHVEGLLRFDSVVGGTGHGVINLGTGHGTTVRQLVTAFEQVTGEPMQVTESGPRPGDVAGCYTRSQRAADLLDWRAERSLEQGIADSLAWAKVRDQRLSA
ncbi:UDP-glucose 4-epimerase GalE [Angustibacter aerolatus]